MPIILPLIFEVAFEIRRLVRLEKCKAIWRGIYTFEIEFILPGSRTRVLAYHRLTCVINFFLRTHVSCDRLEPRNTLVLKSANMSSWRWSIKRNKIVKKKACINGKKPPIKKILITIHGLVK